MVEGRDELVEAVRRAQSGSVEAFEDLYRAHQAGIYTFIRSQVREAELAADLAQQTFVRAWESLPKLREVGAFRGWLHRIALNLIRDEAKSGRARLEVAASALEDYDLAEMAGSDEDTLVRTVVASELKQQVQAALRALPDEQRQAVVMHHLEGMPVVEIAQAMGVRPGTVMSRLARARDALRGRLSRYVEAESGGTG